MQWLDVLVATARNAADLLASSFAQRDSERLAILYLNADRSALGIEEYPGFAHEAALPMRAIFASALRRHAAGMVIAHNHPSGDPLPSPADIEATRRFASVADVLGIRLHDHLIFAGDGCRSFRELGLL